MILFIVVKDDFIQWFPHLVLCITNANLSIRGNSSNRSTIVVLFSLWPSHSKMKRHCLQLFLWCVALSKTSILIEKTETFTYEFLKIISPFCTDPPLDEDSDQAFPKLTTVAIKVILYSSAMGSPVMWQLWRAQVPIPSIQFLFSP